MHRNYQPLKPSTNKYLQKRWDQTRYENHLSKVKSAKPIVDTKGISTPAHVQLKLKKLQLEEERLAIIERDNHLLSSKLAEIMRSKGLVDHRNDYPERSLHGEKRREELLLVTRQNQAILQRITARQSEYRRQVWEEDWDKVERMRDDIARYPRGVTHQQRTKRKVKFRGSETESSSEESGQVSETNSNRETEDSARSSETSSERIGYS
ncbi:uncharacterized protein si:ch211-284k5.2 [Megalops cyprinoides]|uniref:uncharacterized protein si:ch211-284k5.2 n=1 Tax=Megalops cyprinoides TaxID=118141 RepID=UPI001864BE44|nr:uncharacterized protein si:ch211-284k5.2 [Megalops cyprinoides]